MKGKFELRIQVEFEPICLGMIEEFEFLRNRILKF